MKSQSLSRELFSRRRIGSYFSLMRRLPDPDTVLAQAGITYNAYRELTTDPHLFAAIEQRKSAVMMMDWRLNPNGADEHRSLLVMRALASLDVESVISQILNAVLFGYSVLEIIWKYDGSMILPNALIEKPREWFYFNDENRLCYDDRRGRDGNPVPEYKCLLAQNQPTYENPYGEKVLSRCYYPVLMKRSGLDFWNTFIERYAMPFLAAKQSKTASEEERQALLEALEKMMSDTFGIIPDDASVEFISGSSSATSEVYKKFMDFCNNEISKAVLSQTLTMDIQDRGTYAAAQTHQQMLRYIILADKRLVERSMNALIRMIWDLNFGEDRNKSIPVFELSSEEK